MTLVDLTLAWLLAFAPPEKLHQFPGHEETLEERHARYASAAADIVEVAEAPEDKPNGLSDRDEAALLVAIAIGESGMAKDADSGPCYRIGKAWRTRCDSGAAASLWQVHAFWPMQNPDGSVRVVKLEELFADRRLAATIALHVATGSLRQCRKLDAIDHLSALSGRCQPGLKSAQARYRLWQRVRVWTPPKVPNG